MSIAKKILLDELIENSHIEKVEDVIYWALDKYSKSQTNGGIVASSLIARIKNAEEENKYELMNPEVVESVLTT